ncbi:unnamed protein product [Dicrocoelium dendriticum]|nr:unnamed protein product [Dicrocoelium dendriticum]
MSIRRPLQIYIKMLPIQDSWDAPEPEAAPKPKAVAQEKLPLAEKIRLKEEKRRKEKEEKLKQQEEERTELSMTERQREKLAEEAELALLQDTFGQAPVPSAPKDGIDACDPVTKEEFNRLNQLMKEKLSKLEKSPHYSSFADRLIRDAITEMDVESLKTLSTVISALAAEKQRLAKGKGKKKSKGKLIVEREDDYDIEEDGVEYDDFI